MSPGIHSPFSEPEASLHGSAHTWQFAEDTLCFCVNLFSVWRPASYTCHKWLAEIYNPLHVSVKEEKTKQKNLSKDIKGRENKKLTSKDIKTRLLHFSQASGRNWHFTYAPVESNQSENSSLPFSQITVIISNIAFQFTLLQGYASMNQ